MPSARVNPERAAQAVAAAEEVERRLQNVVDKTEGNLINIGDADYLHELPETMVEERQKAYTIISNEVSCLPLPVLPVPSKSNKTAASALVRESLVNDADHAMVAAAAEEIAAAAAAMAVNPVDAELVIDFKALTVA
jgi:hypothetical protein